MSLNEVDIRMTKARSDLIRHHPFFGALSMRLRLVERNDIGTMMTNGTFLWFARTFLDKMSESVALFAVAHEVLHCALGHHVRRGGRDPKLWNIACDYVVNWLLYEAGFEVPKWAYLDAQYKDLTADQVYRILENKKKAEEEAQKQAQQNQAPPDDDQDSGGKSDDEDEDESDKGSPKDFDEDQDDDDCNDGDQDDDGQPGSGDQPDEDGDADQGDGDPEDEEDQPGEDGQPGGEATGEGEASEEEKLPETCGDPGGCGEIVDAAPEYDQAAKDEAAEEWQVYTRQAVNVARKAGEGKLPGFLEEVVDTLNDPRTDWRDVLRRFVDPSNNKDYSWANPNKRYMSMGYYTPGLISDGINHAVILIDTSISIDYEWLRTFGGEAQSALDDGAIDKVTVIFIDEQVHGTAEYNKGDQIDFTVQGRGGTAFSPGFRWVEENLTDVSVAIYFTDLECSDYGPEPPYPVLWAAYGQDPRITKMYMDRVPWGECVELQ